jgi:hypothetical protein
MRAARMAATARKRRQRVPLGPSQNGGFGVNERLTPRTRVETSNYTQFVVRAIRGLGRRAEEGDLQALVGLRQLDQALALETLRAVHALHVTHGHSWAELGLAAGVSRQAAQQCWGG